MITETRLKTEIVTTICGGKFRVNQNFRDHVRTYAARVADLAGLAEVARVTG
jgi:hypothetical protein